MLYQSFSFSPSCSGFSIDVGKARKVLHVLIFRISASGQGSVHVTRVSVSCGVHGWTCVAWVCWWDFWPARSYRGWMQSWGTAHQTGLHPGCWAIERILRNKNKWKIMLNIHIKKATPEIGYLCLYCKG